MRGVRWESCVGLLVAAGAPRVPVTFPSLLPPAQQEQIPLVCVFRRGRAGLVLHHGGSGVGGAL